MHPHEPPGTPSTEDAATTRPAGYRAHVPGFDPKALMRTIRRCHGFPTCSLAPREAYPLAEGAFTISHSHGHMWELVLDGPDAEQIRDLLAQLGLDQENATIHALAPAAETA